MEHLGEAIFRDDLDNSITGLGDFLTPSRWIGKEVTGDSFYKKINMRARALKAHRQGLSHEIRDHRDW